MSLDIVRKVNQDHPELLRVNIDATCYQFVALVIAELRAQGHEAYHICKTHGEGQYTPPGFLPRTVVGLDGKVYVCTGVSHDALWSDGKQYDTVAAGNDSPDPIFDGSGQRIHGTPVWNAIPPEFWRPQNPPLKDGTTPTPVPQPPTYPSYESMGGDDGGKQVTRLMEADYKRAEKPGLDGDSGAWQWRTAYDFLTGICKTVEDSIAKHQPEWRESLNAERASVGKPPIAW